MLQRRTFVFLTAATLCSTTLPALAGKPPFYVPTKAEKEAADYGEFP